MLPEKHTHNQVPVQHQEFRHEDPQIGHQQNVAHLGNFKPTLTEHETHHTSAAAPTVTGERTVHHVHEQVQPIIYKDVYQPEVVHTVQPVHETHHAPSEHHGISMLPTRTADELKTHGIDLVHGSGGIAHHKQEYEGHPRGYNPKYQLQRNPIDVEPTKHYGLHDMDKTNHPYESTFESPMAEPITTALGYKSGPSQFRGERIRTDPGKSAHGYAIEQPPPIPKGMPGTSGPNVDGVASRRPDSRDHANDLDKRTSQSLDPRSHWSPTENSSQRNSQVVDPQTPTKQGIPQQRPDSGIAIPDRTVSRGQDGLDGRISRPGEQTPSNQQASRKEVFRNDGPMTTTRTDTPYTTTTTSTSTTTSSYTNRR